MPNLARAVISSVVLLGGIALGQENVAEPPPGTASVAMASQIDLARLIDLCADRLKLRIDYDPGAVKGQVTLRMPDGLTDAELWALTNQLLAQRGFTTVRAPGAQTLSVVKASDATQVARIEPGSAGGDGNAGVSESLVPGSLVGDAGFATLVMSPRVRTVKEVAEAVKPLLTKGVGTATALGETRLLLISDYSARLAEIQGLLDRIDAAAAATVVEEIAVVNVPPAALAAAVMQVALKRDQMGGEKLVGEVIPSPSGSGVVVISPEAQAAAWREMVTKFDQREMAETRNYVPRVFAAADVAKLLEQMVEGSTGPGGKADDRWRLVVDDLTGTLVVTATPSQHAQVASLMERLDAAQGGPLPMRSYPIRNRPVGEMIEALSKLIEAGVLDASADAVREDVRAGAEQRTVRDLNTGATSAASGNGPMGSARVAPPSGVTSTRASGNDAETRTSLRLTADEATNTLIALGEPRMLSQLESLLQMLDVRQPQVMLEVVLVSISDTDALNLGVELERLGNVGDAAYKVASLFGLSTASGGTRTVADAAGFTGAVLDPGEFSVVVRALQAINKGRSLSNPKVLVTNNEQARFSSVLQQPFVRTDTTSNTATSSFGGSDSAGTTISVKPQIAAGDHLVLTYSINLSSFVGTPAAAGLPPPKQQNSVDSVATIPDGHTVVVGGLELESDSTSTSQIPLLGKIPLVGELFKNRAIGKNRTRFFAFINATVLRSSSLEDLKYISRVDGDAMGVDDGWPEVEPRIIR